MRLRPPAHWREHLTSPLTWHYAGAGALLMLTIVLGIWCGIDFMDTSMSHSDALANKQVDLKALELETVPLRGLDKRVDKTREQIKEFYAKRIPTSYSAIAGRIGELQVKAGVRLTRVSYLQGRPGARLTEITMDAGISGEYPQIMRFVNALERDQTFFVIRAMSLTGQQGGLVNLRLRFSTWMRPEDAAASGLPTATGTEAAAPAKESE